MNLNADFRLAKIQEEYLMALRKSWRGSAMYSSKSSFDMGEDAANVHKSTIPIKKVFSSQICTNSLATFQDLMNDIFKFFLKGLCCFSFMISLFIAETWVSMYIISNQYWRC